MRPCGDQTDAPGDQDVAELSLKVKKTKDETPTIRSFLLVDEKGDSLPEWTAGAHIDVTVHLPDGSVGARSYSLANKPGDTKEYLLGVLNDENGTGGSAYICDQVKEGDVIAATVPKNDFPLAEDAKQHILIAGGIGITPILAMARDLAARRKKFVVHYVSRTTKDMAFRKEVEKICKTKATLYFDGGDPSKGMDLKKLLAKRPAGAHVYVCGPIGLIDAVIKTARDANWPEDAIHFELFAAATGDGDDKALTVVLQRSGITIQVPPDKTILEVVLEQGIDVDYDCVRGECGMCQAAIIEGKPVHRDYYLNRREREEGKLMMICCSWAESDKLVLDI